MACENLKEKTIITRVGSCDDRNHFTLLKISSFTKWKKSLIMRNIMILYDIKKEKHYHLNNDMPSILRFMSTSDMFKCEINVHPRMGEIWCYCLFLRWPSLGGCQRNKGKLDQRQGNFSFLFCLLFPGLFPILFIIILAIQVLYPAWAFGSSSSTACCMHVYGILITSTTVLSQHLLRGLSVSSMLLSSKLSVDSNSKCTFFSLLALGVVADPTAPAQWYLSGQFLPIASSSI